MVGTHERSSIFCQGVESHGGSTYMIVNISKIICSNFLAKSQGRTRAQKSPD